jgi:hypothetical protein
MNNDKLEEFLVQWLSEYASKPGADPKWAERIFDLRWKPELKIEEIGPLFHRIAWRAGERVRADGFNEFNSQYVMQISRELATYLAEFATVESKTVVQTLNELTAEPPRAAEFALSLFLKGEKGDALIGDLNERFEQDRECYGAKRARRIYWGRALRSLWPLFCRALKRAIKWGVVIDSVWRHF